VLGLLDVIGDLAAVVEFEHTEVDLDVASPRRDRQRGPVFAMKPDQVVEVQISEQVTVHHEKGVVEPFDEREGACRSARLFFEHVGQV
jgi:hypothetical protein